MDYSKLFQAILIASTVSITGCIDMDSSRSGGSDPAPQPQPQPEPEPEPEPEPSPEASTLSKAESSGSKFSFNWTAVDSASYYRIYEKPNAESGFSQVGGDIPPEKTSLDLDVPVFERYNASYFVEACNDSGCADSNMVHIEGDLSEHIDYLKAPNSNNMLKYGSAIAVSGDGNTLVIGAPRDDSAQTGVNATPVNEPNTDNYGSAGGANTNDYGAVHVYVKEDGDWVYDAYIKPSVIDTDDDFGYSVAISHDGTVLGVGMPGEASNDPLDPNYNYFVANIGTTILFKKDENGQWAQTDYLKPTYGSYSAMRIGEKVEISADGKVFAIAVPDASPASVWVYKQDLNNDWVLSGQLQAIESGSDFFTDSIDMSADGSVIAVGARGDDSCSTVINGDAADNSCSDTGSVTMFYEESGSWNVGDYIKAPNAEDSDSFGYDVALSDDGQVLAVSAIREKGGQAGINTDMFDNSGYNVGAVYILENNNNSWSFTDYIKPSTIHNGFYFGTSVALDGDGDTLVAGTPDEDSAARGVNGDELDTSITNAGAAYVFKRKDGVWSQLSYLKSPNNGDGDSSAGDRFGTPVEINANGSEIFIQSEHEDGDDTGINNKAGNFYDAPTAYDTPSRDSGAVYIF